MRKATNYLDHFCACKVGVFASILTQIMPIDGQNLDLQMELKYLLDYLHTCAVLVENAVIVLKCTSTKTHGYILRMNADIHNNDFDLPTLGYLHI